MGYGAEEMGSSVDICEMWRSSDEDCQCQRIEGPNKAQAEENPSRDEDYHPAPIQSPIELERSKHELNNIYRKQKLELKEVNYLLNRETSTTSKDLSCLMAHTAIAIVKKLSKNKGENIRSHDSCLSTKVPLISNL